LVGQRQGLHDLKVVGIVDRAIDDFKRGPVECRVAPNAKHLGTPAGPENWNGALGAIFGVTLQEVHCVDIGLEALVIRRLPDDAAVQTSSLFAESALVVTSQKAIARLGCAFLHEDAPGFLRVLVVGGIGQQKIFVHFKV
jgi:hypothetical protein